MAVNYKVRVNNLLTRAAPLAEWNAKNKPNQKVLRVSAEDMASLQGYFELPKERQDLPVTLKDGKFWFRGFELAPMP